MLIGIRRSCVIVASLYGLCAFVGTGHAAAGIQLEYIGQAIFPTGYSFDGSEVGGLSGIDYDPIAKRYIALSDARGDNGPARFYDLTIDLSDGVLNSGDVRFKKVTKILDENNEPVAPGSVDPESIRIAAFPGVLYWTSESGAGRDGAAPFIHAMTPNGRPLAAFHIPDKFIPGQNQGIRPNLAFESLAYGRFTHRWYSVVENALTQDGPKATLAHGSPARLVSFSAVTGRPADEYVYPVSPIPEAPVPATASANNGISGLLAYAPGLFITLERAFSAGVGNDIKLFLTTPIGASRVQQLPALAGRRVRTMKKILLLDLGRLNVPLDNIEGITFGPIIDGDRTLVLVSDNNFSDSQITEFLAFRIHDRWRRRLDARQRFGLGAHQSR